MSDQENSKNSSSISAMPINRYELQAILFPGFLLTCAISIALLAIKLNNSKPASEQVFFALSIIKDNLSLTIITVISFLVLSYILGHVLDAVSSLLFERTMFTKFYGNPYRICLNSYNNHSTYRYRPFLKATIVVVFCIPLLYVLIRSNNISKNYYLCIQFILLFIGFILFSEFFLKQIFLKQIDKNSVFRKVFFIQKKYVSKLLVIIGSPFTIINNVFTQYFSIFTPLNSHSISQLRVKMKKYLENNEIQSLGSEAYWLAYWDVCNSSSFFQAEINKFRNMAIFFRSLSLSLYLSTLCLLTCYRESWSKTTIDTMGDTRFFFSTSNITFLVYLFLALSVIFFYKFILFHTFETKSVFRAFLTLEPKD